MTRSTFSVEHELFVPREVVYDLWTSPDHHRYWWTALGSAQLVTAESPSHLLYRFTDTDKDKSAEVEIELQEHNGRTRIRVTQRGRAPALLPDGADEWQPVFAALENYLSAI